MPNYPNLGEMGGGRKRMRITCADIKPVGVWGGEFPVNTGLDDINPLGELNIPALLQVLGVRIDEIRGRDVLHWYSSLRHLDVNKWKFLRRTGCIVLKWIGR
jgi:hypothetical protein